MKAFRQETIKQAFMEFPLVGMYLLNGSDSIRLEAVRSLQWPTEMMRC